MEQIDFAKASIAKVYAYWLGDESYVWEADRELAERMLARFPGVRDLIQANRRFILAATRWLAAQGLRQFLDIGAGIPVSPAVHEVGEETAQVPVRVVYADNDPLVVYLAKQILAGHSVAAVAGDVRDPEAILADPAVRAAIDLSRPVAVILGAVLHFLPAGQAADVTARLMRPLPAGSALVLSVAHIYDQDVMASLNRAGHPASYHNHGIADVTRFFTAAGLPPMRGEAGDVARWPLLGQPSANSQAAVLGGVAIKGPVS